MAEPNYKIEYSTDNRVRVSNAEYETEFVAIPDDGQMVVSIGADDDLEVLLVTLENYDGDLEPNSVFVIGEAEDTEIVNDVDPDETGEDDGEEGEEDAGEDAGEEGGEGEEEDK